MVCKVALGNRGMTGRCAEGRKKRQSPGADVFHHSPLMDMCMLYV